ncbi:hypothetical protein [Actinoallomurus sp. CA-142502]|uniref:hypothetical protein n=1 Tax=Actinoallomurus sp. CA-142502 TaxID=3239885 RepID=UPI003D8A8F89
MSLIPGLHTGNVGCTVEPHPLSAVTSFGREGYATLFAELGAVFELPITRI